MKRIQPQALPLRTLTSSLVVAALLFVSACGGETEDPELGMPDTTMMNDLDMRAPTDADTVEVQLSEYSIDMPSSIAAGNRVFRVVNNGDEEHSFEIEGVNVSESLMTPLAAGEEETLQVRLEPGSYEVYCPVDNHAEQGMRMTLQVTQDNAGMGTDTTGAGAGQMPRNPGLTQ